MRDSTTVPMTERNTEPQHVLLSKAGVGRSSGRRDLPPVLLRLAVRRTRVLALVLLGIELVGWFLSQLLEGDLGHEFQYIQQWGPPTFAIVASLVLLGLTSSSRVGPAAVVTAALTYEVVVSFAIALSTYWFAFRGVPAGIMNGDVVGFSGVALWMFFFTVMVPVHPRYALAALLLSATAVPIVYLLEVHGGRAPALAPYPFFSLFVVPYLVVAGLAYLAARTIYRLGQDVTRARELGSYRLVEWLGQGGMGEVWRAEHRLLARPAAVKLIHSSMLGPDAGTASTMIARFEREAQTTATLQSPHTVEVYDYGTTEDGTFYYVMELLEGIDLQDLVQRFGPQPPARVVHVLRQACGSLSEAHRRGLVHRDVKPANIYLCERAFEHDFVKVLDFGLVKWRGKRSAEDELQLTATGSIQGTPAYMAPEIVMGDGPVDGRADLYCLGCVAWWLLTGRPVFEERTYGAMLMAHAQKPAPPPSQAAAQPVPASLDAIVLNCLRKAPADRIQTAEELAAGLDAVELPEPWTAARAREWWEAHGAAVAERRPATPPRDRTA